MKIEKVTTMNIQGKTASKEVSSKFKEMMQVFEGMNKKIGKEAEETKGIENSKEAMSKDAENNKDVNESKEVENKDVKNEAQKEMSESKEAKGAKEIENCKEAIRTQWIAGEKTDVKEYRPVSKEAKTEEQGSEGIEVQRQDIPIELQGSAGTAIRQGEIINVVTDKGEKGSSIQNLELHKQLDNAWMLKPQIKEVIVETKTTTELKEEIESLTGKEVELSFRKELGGRKEEAEKVQTENVEIVQGSKPQGSEDVTEKIRIKVGEPQELAPKVVEKIREKIEILQTGEKTYEIDMDPKGLGKIHVKISFGEKGTSLEMVFSEKKTMDMMAKHLESMDGLQNSKGGSVDIQMSEQTQPDHLDRQQQRQQEQQQREQQRKSEEFIDRIKETIKEQDPAER